MSNIYQRNNFNTKSSNFEADPWTGGKILPVISINITAIPGNRYVFFPVRIASKTYLDIIFVFIT